jgi:hypothetical protein
MMSRDKTHSEDCWRVHHECAIAKIERQSEALHADNLAATVDLLEQTRRERDALQAELDALMLEYCPGDMTPEQVENWKRNQNQK